MVGRVGVWGWCGLGNGVKTAGGERVAAEDAAEGEPEAVNGAVEGDGDVGVLGAGGEVAAVAEGGRGEDGGEEAFVEEKGEAGDGVGHGGGREAGLLWEGEREREGLGRQ